jgi:hypothetical protein
MKYSSVAKSPSAATPPTLLFIRELVHIREDCVIAKDSLKTSVVFVALSTSPTTPVVVTRNQVSDPEKINPSGHVLEVGQEVRSITQLKLESYLKLDSFGTTGLRSDIEADEPMKTFVSSPRSKIDAGAGTVSTTVSSITVTEE